LNQIATEIPAKAMLLADAFLARSTDLSIKKRQSTIPDLVTAGKILLEFLIIQ
jgi:hypothetical protein